MCGSLQSIVFLLLFIILQKVDCDRVKEKIYRDVTATAMCFRRFNATHQIGCSSVMGGNVGVLHYVDQQSDLDWLLKKGPHQPYIVLLTPHTFNSETVAALRASKKVNGILIIFTNDTDLPNNFSPEKKCPNQAFDRYGQGSCSPVWNQFGNELIYENLEFPIVAILDNKTVTDLINDCYVKYNRPSAEGSARHYPLCSVHIKDEMDGAKDTETCMRRSKLQNNLQTQSYCDPIGGFNVYAFLPAVKNSKPVKPGDLIVLSAKLDAMSMFDILYPGADSAVSGFVTLLAIAEALGKVKTEVASTSKPLMISFFNGESFDYIGSERLAYDMESHLKFPYSSDSPDTLQAINVSHFGSYLELGQVGSVAAESLWLHSDPWSINDTTIGDKVSQLATDLIAAGSKASIKIERVANIAQRLPPSSVQSFLKKRPFASLVIEDFETNYANKYYNSHYDLPELIGLDYGSAVNDTYDMITPASTNLSKLATALAQVVFGEMTGGLTADHVKANETTVANLLYCFLVSTKCELFNTVLDEDLAKTRLISGTYPLYVGVSTTRNFQVPDMVMRLLTYYLGDQVNRTQEECKGSPNNPTPVSNFVWMQGPVDPITGERTSSCYETTANFTLARSPAFDIPGYSWSSNKYSSWTESVWQTNAFHVRYFLVPSVDKQLTVLFVGIGIFLVSLLVAYLLKKRGQILFAIATNNELSSEPMNNSSY